MSETAQEFHKFIRSRRSVRRFRPEPVPRPVVERILETATWTPSAHNRQPWRFVILESTGAREQLAGQMGAAFHQDLIRDGMNPSEASAQVERSRQRILEAPVVVLLCMDMSEMDAYPDTLRQGAERSMAMQSTALAGGTLLLAAYSEGLGGVWVCAPLFAQQAVRQSLSLPASWEPQALLLLGYPAKIPEARARKTVKEVARFI